MREKTLYQMGVDINNNWTFANGDLQLIKYDKNIQQVVNNRLTCVLDALDIFYFEYGTLLFEYLGKKNDLSTHEYIRIEIEKRLAHDPRFKHVECVVNNSTSETVDVNLTFTFFNGEEYENNFVIGIYGVEKNG